MQRHPVGDEPSRATPPSATIRSSSDELWAKTGQVVGHFAR